MTPDEIHSSFMLENAKYKLTELDRTLLLAEARSLPVKEILQLLSSYPDREYREALLYRLKELSLTGDESQDFWQIIMNLSETGDAPGTSKTRPKIDRVLMHLSYALPDERRRELARMFLRHKRKTRRDIAYRALKDCGIDRWCAEALFEQVKIFRDAEPENILARNAGMLEDKQVSELLCILGDEYWQMRVLQSLIETNRLELAWQLALKYPEQFVRAVGRTERADLLPSLRELLVIHRGKVSFLGIYSWCLGRLKAQSDLVEVRRIVDSLRAQLERWHGGTSLLMESDLLDMPKWAEDIAVGPGGQEIFE